MGTTSPPQVGIVPLYDSEGWIRSLSDALPDVEVVPIGTADPDRIEHVVGWFIDADAVASLPNVRSVHVTGAGYDHIDLDRLPDLPFGRLVDPGMALDIANYCVAWTIHFTRDFDVYAADQRQKFWDRDQRPLYARDVTVGVVGAGAIGEVVVDQLSALGFAAIGWSRSNHDRPLLQLFADSNVIVLMVPLTDETRGLVDDELLSHLDNGVLINVARGAIVDDDALRQALDGRLRAAVLDVFETEPLPADAWQWTHPKVVVTPHIAGRTDPRTAARLVAADIVAVRKGGLPAVPVPR